MSNEKNVFEPLGRFPAPVLVSPITAASVYVGCVKPGVAMASMAVAPIPIPTMCLSHIPSSHCLLGTHEQGLSRRSDEADVERVYGFCRGAGDHDRSRRCPSPPRLPT